MVSRRLSHYRIISPLGAGGMGEVYLAEDTRLNRKVALKLLPKAFTQDQQRLRRFTQEAKAASALNHPNILTIYDIGEAEAVHFIATEYIEGATLRQCLRGAPLSVTEALEIAVQIASALAAAHRVGIIHRDLKPENVMRRPDGIVKVLDFGLAKLIEPQALLTDSAAPTIARANTDPGTILGTVNYMSPEQARGKPVDGRSDLFSLGVMIYEMVTGQPPFAGETASDLIAAILKSEPPLLIRHTAEAPPELERIVTKALAKDQEERYQTAKDLMIDLKRLRRQMEVEAEVERSLSPESSKPPVMTTAGGAAAATASEMAAPSPSLPAGATSSAEYLVTGIKRHKVMVLILVAVLAAAIIGLTRYWHATNTEVAIESIAVLPFENQSQDPDADYLSDGITESIINNLAQLANLRVIARSTVFRYKGKATDPLAVGKELGIRAVLVGRLLQRGDSIIISAELVDVRDNKQIWGEKYNRKMTDLIALQSEIARDVSAKLRVKLSGAEEQKVTKKYTANPEAYQLYLRGRYHWDKRLPQEVQKAIEYFQQAIAADPSYALAYTGLADTYAVQMNNKARENVQKALSLDGNLAEAHATLGSVLLQYDYDFAGSEREFKRALELNPNYATAHQWYGVWFVYQGRFDEGLAEYRRALEIDPLSFAVNFNYGLNLYYARRYDEAITQAKKILELDANSPAPPFVLSLAYFGKGMYPEAVEEYTKYVVFARNRQAAALLRERFAKGGLPAFWRALLGEIQRANIEAPYDRAIGLAALGEKDQAFAELNKAYDTRAAEMIRLKIEPFFDPLRDDPRFQALLARVGFPP